VRNFGAKLAERIDWGNPFELSAVGRLEVLERVTRSFLSASNLSCKNSSRGSTTRRTDQEE